MTPELEPARMLQLHITEQDRHGDQPLYEAVVRKCREMQIAGATVFRGLEGYGGSSQIHRPHLLGRDLPVVVTIVDSAEKIDTLAPALEQMMGRGLLVISEVLVRRVQR